MNKRGFFAGSQLVSKAPIGIHPKCGACGLHKYCNTPKMSISGRGERRIMVIGEAPGEAEDNDGRAFVGKSGVELRKRLRAVGIDLDQDCWATNAIICRPSVKKGKHTVLTNRTPTDLEIEYCRPNLLKAINELKPIAFLLLGTAAVHSLIGHIWRESPGSINRWQGWSIPCQRLNAWVFPTYHPSTLLHEDDVVLHQMFESALERLSDVDNAPFNDSGSGVPAMPNEKAEVELVHSPDRAAKMIRKMIEKGGPVAFDYETNMLKPDSPKSEIVSCSVCWRGKVTIAYPWLGDAVKATRELLRSPLPKIASNLKFEERWTRRHLKTRVRNWYWDTMLAAHIIDNRNGITSIKFQSFVLLGSDIWDDHIQQFLHTPKHSDSDVNQILEEIDINDLLLYNGLDSLLEYRVAAVQMEQLQYPKPKGL